MKFLQLLVTHTQALLEQVVEEQQERLVQNNIMELFLLQVQILVLQDQVYQEQEQLLQVLLQEVILVL